MSLIKKIDVPSHFAAQRARRRAGALFMSQPRSSGLSAAKTTGTKRDAHSSTDDFSLEHSSVTAIPAQIAADAVKNPVIAVPGSRKA